MILPVLLKEKSVTKSTISKMSEEMAPIPFKVLKYCGFWNPLKRPSLGMKIYSLYTGLMLGILITIALLVLIAVCQMPFTDDLFAESVFLMFALINANFKAINVLLSRRKFIKMLAMAQDDKWHKLRSIEEEQIRRKYSKTIRKISVYFTTAVFIAIILRIIAPFFDTSGEIVLPINAYHPCKIETPHCYWSLYWHQAIGTGVATLIHAAKDCLISALLLQTCSQLEILKHRLRTVTDVCNAARNRKETPKDIILLERNLVHECVQLHESTFKFAKILNESLSVMLFGQIATTMPNLCLSIYLLSKQSIGSVDFMMTTQFFSAVVIELFFFCWYGNEVTLNSLDIESAVSDMEWTTLTAASKKDLLMIMIRSTKPIVFRVGPIMNMNIDSFLSIMKTSYSAFNVLQSTSE